MPTVFMYLFVLWVIIKLAGISYWIPIGIWLCGVAWLLNEARKRNWKWEGM